MRNREAEHPQQLPVRRPHQSYLSIDQHGAYVVDKRLRKCNGSLRPVARETKLFRYAWTCGPFVDVHHNIRIEHRNEPFKIARPYGSEKRFGDLSLFAEAGRGNSRRALDSPSRAAGELPRSFGRAAENRSNLIEGDRKLSCSNNVEPLCRDQARRARSAMRNRTASASRVSCSGSLFLSLVAIDSVALVS